jgi:galactose mutarotase-like enzyme
MREKVNHLLLFYRVKEGKFVIGGVEYQLSLNDAGTDHRHHVHGGEVSFDRLNWNTEVVNQGVVFSILSPDGSEVCSRILLEVGGGGGF